MGRKGVRNWILPIYDCNREDSRFVVMHKITLPSRHVSRRRAFVCRWVGDLCKISSMPSAPYNPTHLLLVHLRERTDTFVDICVHTCTHAHSASWEGVHRPSWYMGLSTWWLLIEIGPLLLWKRGQHPSWVISHLYKGSQNNLLLVVNRVLLRQKNFTYFNNEKRK